METEPQPRPLVPVAVAGWVLILLALAPMALIGPHRGDSLLPWQIAAVGALGIGVACGAAAFVAALVRLSRGQRGAAIWAPLALGLVPVLLVALLAVAALMSYSGGAS